MEAFISPLKQLFAILREPVEYMGVRMFVAFAAVAGIIALVVLIGLAELTLTDTVAVASVAMLGIIAIVSVVGRTVTDLSGKRSNGDQPDEPSGDNAGE